MVVCLAIGGGASTFMHGLAATGGRTGPAAKREVGGCGGSKRGTPFANCKFQQLASYLGNIWLVTWSVECAALTEHRLDRPSAWGNVKWEARRQSDSLMISNIPALPSPRSTGPARPYTVALSIYLQSDTTFWLHFMFKNNMTWLPEEIAVASPGEPPEEQISELKRKGNGGGIQVLLQSPLL